MGKDRRSTHTVDDLLDYIDASPTPYHAVCATTQRLEAAGWRALDAREQWSPKPGERVYTVRGDSSIAAFHIGAAPPSQAGFRLVGAHTDSPNLRVKPNPEIKRHGYHQLGLEVYGGVLLSTWLDRDLSLAGRVSVRGQDGSVQTHLLDFRRPLLRIPTLAIHLDRSVNTEGLVVNPQQHLVPLLGLEKAGAVDFPAMLCEELRPQGIAAAPSDVLGWDLCAYDLQPSSRAGVRRELIHAPRLDNLASCHAALQALIDSAAHDGNERDWTYGIVLYDHEECGSRSAKGAGSPFLRQTLERLAVAASDDRADSAARSMTQSFLVSADMAHALHPNYVDRHEPEHQPVLGGGPVVKVNVNQAYATDGPSWARFENYCRLADVPSQRYVNRNDMTCGSTIGPITAAQIGIPTVDVGNPMLSMHSSREVAAADDHPQMIAALRAMFANG